MSQYDTYFLMKETDVPEDLYQEMKDLFERADFVKFAKFTATEEENAQVLPQAVRFVTTTYQVDLENQALGRAPAEGVSRGHTSPGAAGVYEGAEPPVSNEEGRM